MFSNVLLVNHISTVSLQALKAV